MKSLRWRLGCLAGVVLLAALSGCKREEKVEVPPLPPTPAGMGNPGMKLPPPLEETGTHAAGKKVYNAQACARCHSMGKAPGGPAKGGPAMGGPGKGGPKAKGPDLAKAGAKEGRTADWFVAYVSNPKKENPDSKMPAFENKIKADDMRALAEFLASLK